MLLCFCRAVAITLILLESNRTSGSISSVEHAEKSSLAFSFSFFFSEIFLEGSEKTKPWCDLDLTVWISSAVVSGL